MGYTSISGKLGLIEVSYTSISGKLGYIEVGCTYITGKLDYTEVGCTSSQVNWITQNSGFLKAA